MKFLKGLHHLFFGTIAYVAAAFMFSAGSRLDQIGLSANMRMLLGVAVFLIATGRIISFNHHHRLRGGNKFFWQRRKVLSLFCAFCTILLFCLVYLQIVEMRYVFPSRGPEGMTQQEAQDLVNASTINMWVMILGCLYLWILSFNMLYTGLDRKFHHALIGFAKEQVSVYLLFRVGIFVLTLVASVFMGLFTNGVQNSYFLFAMDDSAVQGIASGSISGSGFFGSVTAASSFVVLSTMAEEFLTQGKTQSFRQRLINMFLETDTVKLLVTTVCCMVTSLLFAGKDGLLSSLFNGILIILWLISMLLFIADTRILDFLINFCVLGFVERLIPMPQMDSFIGILLALLSVTGRIALFAFVALMIGNYQIFRRQQLVEELTNNKRLSRLLWARITHATFLDALLLFMRVSERGLKGLFKSDELTEDEWLTEKAVYYAQVAEAFFNMCLDPLREKAARWAAQTKDQLPKAK